MREIGCDAVDGKDLPSVQDALGSIHSTEGDWERVGTLQHAQIRRL